VTAPKLAETCSALVFFSSSYEPLLQGSQVLIGTHPLHCNSMEYVKVCVVRNQNSESPK
jgi:hypothetical protein